MKSLMFGFVVLFCSVAQAQYPGPVNEEYPNGYGYNAQRAYDGWRPSRGYQQVAPNYERSQRSPDMYHYHQHQWVASQYVQQQQYGCGQYYYQQPQQYCYPQYQQYQYYVAPQRYNWCW